MSKFINETQKAGQWVQRQSATQELDIQQLVENLKHGAEVGRDLIEVPRGLGLKSPLEIRSLAPLILRQDRSAQGALEAYRGLRTKLMRAQAKLDLHSIAITSSFPGEGKTLTVMNLGLCYSQLPDQRVLIVDADLRTRGLSQLLGQSDAPGLSEVLTGQCTASEVIRETNHKNFFVLPAGIVATPPPEHFIGPQWQEFLTECKQTFNIILVDSPPVMPLSDFELLSSVCDGYLTVVRAHYAQRQMLKETARALDPKKLLGLVFNASTSNTATCYGYNYGYR